MTRPRCGNDPRAQLTEDDRRAVADFRAYLADRAALRDRIAEAIARRDGHDWGPGKDSLPSRVIERYTHLADAALAALPTPADRAAVFPSVRPHTLVSIACHLDARAVAIMRPDSQTFAEWQTVIAGLRRMADETATTETAPGTCGHRSSEGHPCNEPPGHFGYHRNARQGGNEWTSWVGDTPVIHEDEGCGAEPPDGWPGDCWCTLAAGHEGPRRCGPCSDRHDAPGWSDEPAAGARQDGAAS